MTAAKMLARARVPLGFVAGVAGFLLATPTPPSFAIGMSIAACGEALRVWAAGHLEKGREVTRTGPYRFVRHPLYLGSATMATGFVIAARSWIVAALVATYMIATLYAAIRTEEATLDARFAGEYSRYKDGTAPKVERSFSIARALRNKEYRAVSGLAIGALILWLMARV